MEPSFATPPPEILSTILDQLRGFEEWEGVRILFACESGSRAYGLSRPASDYDIRFVYVHEPGWYLSFTKRKDAQNFFSEDRRLDFSGWDLRKALTLLRMSNPSIMEWPHSPIQYICDTLFLEGIIPLGERYFNPATEIGHYISLGNNYNRKLHSQQGNNSLKLFFSSMRGYLAAKWVFANGTLPPLDFRTLASGTIGPDVVREGVLSLLEEFLEAPRPGEVPPPDKMLCDYLNHLRFTVPGECRIGGDGTEQSPVPPEGEGTGDLDEFFMRMLGV